MTVARTLGRLLLAGGVVAAFAAPPAAADEQVTLRIPAAGELPPVALRAERARARICIETWAGSREPTRPFRACLDELKRPAVAHGLVWSRCLVGDAIAVGLAPSGTVRVRSRDATARVGRFAGGAGSTAFLVRMPLPAAARQLVFEGRGGRALDRRRVPAVTRGCLRGSAREHTSVFSF